MALASLWKKIFLMVLISTSIALIVQIGYIWKNNVTLLQTFNQTVIWKWKETNAVSVNVTKSVNNTSELQHAINNDKATLMNNMSDMTQRGWVTIPQMGRLGNNMFQFAALIAVAKYKNMTPVYPKEILDGIFNIDRSRSLMDSKVDNSLSTISVVWEKSSIYNEDVIKNISANTNVELCCYFQSWKYHVEIQDELKRHFTFKSSTDMIASRFVYGIRSNSKITMSHTHKPVSLVGIHIRRTDMAAEQRRTPNKGYVVAPKEYFENAMNYFKNKLKHVYFIICSDDIWWARHNIKSPNLAFSIGHSPGVDLAILSKCDHIIMSTGTFSWWAAWLSGGDVVYYAGWPKPNSEVAQRFKATDYFLPHWKPMS